MKYGEKLIIDYIEARNETLRDVSGDTEAIVAVLDALEGIHRVFLELLIDAQGPYEFICEEISPDDSVDCEDSDDSDDSDYYDDIF